MLFVWAVKVYIIPFMPVLEVRVHHKPTRERGNEKECDKLQFRRADEKVRQQLGKSETVVKWKQCFFRCLTCF